MTEFSTAAALEVQVSDSSLRSARSKIEDELGDIEVGVTATVSDQLDAGGGAMPDGGGMLASDALDTANERLSEVRDDFEQNLDLNETRNDLLREILDAQQMTAQQNGGSMLNSLLQSGVGLLGGGIAVAAVLAQSLASIDWAALFERAISSIAIEAGDLIMNGGQAIITAADLIADKASVTANDLIEDAASISHEDVIDSTVAVADLLGDGLPVALSALVGSSLPVTVGMLVSDQLPVGPGDIVGNALPVGLAALVGGGLPLVIGDLLAGEFPINPADILKDGQTSNTGQDTGTTDETGQQTGTTDPSGDTTSTPWWKIAGTGAAAFSIQGLLSGSTSGGGLAPGGAPGAGLPLLPAGTFAKGMENLPGNVDPFKGITQSGKAPTSILAPGESSNLETLFSWVTSAASTGEPVAGSDGKVDRRDVAPLPDDVRQTHSGTQVPDYDASDIQVSGGSASGGGGAGGGGSSRNTPDRPEVRVQADVTNEVEAQLDLSNLRDLQDFLRDPERWIERYVDLPSQPGR